MAYQVLARKWRPQQFDDVVGQEHVTRTLKNAISENRVAHAYLLVGPRGTGKTTTARIFAKALNCVKGPTPTPCDQCDACREIMTGSSMDVVEIDAASNTGVDHVRDLRDNARYTPVRGPFKIYVIDEVHMLSAGAFNALLKTLEEPPSHVKFVLATTDPQKVPPTIQSRCQRFDLRRIATPVIAEAIGRIAKAEKVDVDEDALLAIARGAEGGMRDAQSALDQLIAFVGPSIREDDVLSVFGLVSRGVLEELAGAVLTGDVSTILRRIAELDAAGKDMQRLIIELLEHYRNILVALHAGVQSDVLDVTGAQRRVLESQMKHASAGRLLDVVHILTDTDARLRYALSRRTLVEMALIRAARVATMVSIDDILKHLHGLREAVAQQVPPDGTADASSKKQIIPSGAVSEKKSPDPVAPPVPPQPSTDVQPGPEAWAGEHQRLFVHWQELIEQAGHVVPLIKRYLMDAKPLSVEDDRVTIGFDPEFESSLENIDIPRNRSALQKVLGRFLNRNIHVLFKTMTARDTLPGDIKLPEGHTKKERETGESLAPRAQTAEQRWIREPIVRKTLEEFNGEIIDIRE